MAHAPAFSLSPYLVREATEASRASRHFRPPLRPQSMRAKSSVPAITSVVAGAVAAAHCHPKSRFPQLPQLSQLAAAKGAAQGDGSTTHLLQAPRDEAPQRDDGLDSRVDKAWNWIQSKATVGWKAAKQGWTKARSHTSEALKTAQKVRKQVDLPGRFKKARQAALARWKRAKPSQRLLSGLLAVLLLLATLRPARPPTQMPSQLPQAVVSQLLPEEEARLQTLAEASQSVVYVAGKPTPWMPEEPDNPGGPGGSGWMFDRRHVVTSLSNIDLAQRGSLRVIFADRTEQPARVVGTDPGSDLAVLEILWPKRAADARAPRPPALPLGSSASLQLGQDVTVLGRKAALDMSASRGVVYGLGQPLVLNTDRPVQSSIQTDAVISAGNRGGPLLNSRGQVIGMAIAPLEESHIGQAIPADSLNKYVHSILDNGMVSRPALGIYLQPDGFAERLGVHGVVVEEVLPGPAKKAGLRAGDIIIFQGDVAIRRMDDLVTALEMYHPGDGFPLRVLRQTAGEGLGAPFSTGTYSTVDLRVVLGSSDSEYALR